MSVACPCCDQLTMPDDGSFPSSFFICSVCFWEDDDVQLDNPEYAGGANRVNLCNQSDASARLLHMICAISTDAH
jgi:hypothetical protein